MKLGLSHFLFHSLDIREKLKLTIVNAFKIYVAKFKVYALYIVSCSPEDVVTLFASVAHHLSEKAKALQMNGTRFCLKNFTWVLEQNASRGKKYGQYCSVRMN